MTRRKKDDNAAGIFLVIIGVIAWGIYVAVRALININGRFNQRKAFFRAELSRIIDEVERHHGQVEYIADPVALQYLQSLEYAESQAA
ncbi:MAG TPA: hypothetical protein DEF80_16580 [Pantoea sp.]|nr:hypothetical protein [Pantoea sp.]